MSIAREYSHISTTPEQLINLCKTKSNIIWHRRDSDVYLFNDDSAIEITKYNEVLRIEDYFDSTEFSEE